ncbi:MAG: hypothetical protein FGM21_13870 [Limnohabitans sp.]|jgi:hypothetical protein|nr:hypothetical protein [Limnohabitans sp.]
MNKPHRHSKPLPKFSSESEERAYWESKDIDALSHFDMATMMLVKFNNLKSSANRKTFDLTALPTKNPQT